MRLSPFAHWSDAIKRLITSINARSARLHELQQIKLARQRDGLLLLSILGIMTGVLACLLIIAFHLALDSDLGLRLTHSGATSFFELSPLERFALCLRAFDIKA